MPELPEVHTTVTELRKYIVGKKIVAVWSGYDSPHYYGKGQVKDPDYFQGVFSKNVIDATVTDTSRIGKNVLIHLDNDQTILVHMKMTGHLLCGDYAFDAEGNEWTATQPGPLRDDKWNGWIRMMFTFDDNSNMALSDLRKFAKVTLIPTESLQDSEDLQAIGPDPLEKNFSLEIFSERIKKRPTGKIKTVLMDQSLVAGVGNIYSDEALWRAQIHPEKTVKQLPKEKRAKLFEAVKHVLHRGINFKGDSTSDYRTPSGEPGQFQNKHNVYRRTGEPCTKKNCAGIIERKVIGGRSAHFCPVCQKK